VSCLTDRETCDQLVLKELRSQGLQPKLETPKPSKRSLVPFSTPGSSNTPAPQGRVFGKRLTDLSTLFVDIDEHSNIFVPKFVVTAVNYIENHINSVGIYRLAGSNARQKNLRREIESSEIDLGKVDPPPSVLDVATLLKQFLRELPVPVIPAHLHTVLVEAASKDVSSLLTCLLLIPSLHLSCLTFLARHLAKVCANCEVNKMTASNLAIVITPTLFPMQEKISGSKDKRFAPPDKTLKAHTAIVETIINNAFKIGYVPDNLFEKYISSISRGYSTSEDNLDEDCTGPSERKSKKRHRRRSGSLSRVLSVVNKGIRAMARSTTPSRSTEGDPNYLPPKQTLIDPSNFSHTPDPSPRIYSTKRKASGEHKLSPTNKAQKRGFESTFTPKMRTRTFSMKKFKRKKSEMKTQSTKESFTAHADLAFTPQLKERQTNAPEAVRRSPRPKGVPSHSLPASPATRSSNTTFDMSTTVDLSSTTVQDINEMDDTYTNCQFEADYAEVKAEYQQLKVETAKLESMAESAKLEAVDSSELNIDSVEERYKAALANGTLNTDSRQAAKKLNQVKRRSSGNEPKKPRSPSQRRIGAIRRRSNERRGEDRSPGSCGGGGVSPRERGRSTLPRLTVNRASPSTKVPLTPHLQTDADIKGRLARGRPNSTSSGLEKPISSPVMMPGPHGKVVIKHSFRKERPVAGEPVVIAHQQQNQEADNDCKLGPGVETRSFRRQSESLKKLRHDIEDLIEKSFAQDTNDRLESGTEEVFVDSVDGIDASAHNTSNKSDVFEISSRMANVSFNRLIDSASNSPVTRSQLRRQSSAFEFVKPESTVPQRENLRRQSSAFEFRSGPAAVEPIYENMSRDVASRASLRRRNSSVKDLIQKMENEARRRISSAPTFGNLLSGTKPARISEEAPIYDNIVIKEDEVPVFALPDVPEDNSIASTANNLVETNLDENDEYSNTTPTKDEEMWTDGADFFNNQLLNPLPSHVPQCGRSSIVKIRKEHRGRVLDSVSKFSNLTPARGGRPSTARMGVCASPALHPPPPTTRRQTLTGIRTSMGSSSVKKRQSMAVARGTTPHKLPPTPSRAHSQQHRPTPDRHYLAPTTASVNKVREKSPQHLSNKTKSRRSPNSPSKTLKPRRSPHYSTNVVKKKKSPSVVKQQILTGATRQTGSSVAKSANGSNAGKSSVSSAKIDKTSGVKRSTSTGSKKVIAKNRDRRKEKRFLTIGYPEEVRSPLKECQNIHANIKRSNSDQSSTGKVSVKQRTESQDSVFPQAVQVYRNRSLKSDSMMSPSVALPTDKYLTPVAAAVRRAHSDRSTPRRQKYRTKLEVTGGNMRDITVHQSLNRKSPRLSNLI